MPEVNFQEFELYLKSRHPGLKTNSIEAVLSLHSEGGTVPFIARYRKDKTGNLDEVLVRGIIDCRAEFESLCARKVFISSEIEKQGALTDELKKIIAVTKNLTDLEDIYRPYKKMKKTKAKVAKEAGFSPLADWVWALGQGEIQDKTTLEVKAKEYIRPAAGFATYDEVLRATQHIIIEKLANNVELRKMAQEEFFQNGQIICSKTSKFKVHSKYENYADFSEKVKVLDSRKASHRYLALRRGWKSEELKVLIKADEEKITKSFEEMACKEITSQAKNYLFESAAAAVTRYVIPSVTNQVHRSLKERADADSIDVFSENLRKLLMASPFGAKVVLGVDPGLKSGCKIALLDQGGRFISHTVLHILGDKAKENAKKLFQEVLNQIEIKAVAIGNGTGGREAEKLIREVLKELEKAIPVIMVSESGASVYSASDIAREEYPNLDLTVRGAISIAKRLQDPLAELVKVDPKSIGVGQYQHDVSQSLLKKSLTSVVESCVNYVGVDVNTASPTLLQYVSGIGPSIAKNIDKYRQEKGLFKNRSELREVPSVSSKVFEQAAGFLRINEGGAVLDKTGVHPESYQAVKDMAQELKLNVSQLMGEGTAKLTAIREKWVKIIGPFTFDDIVADLAKPGRDPRSTYQVFQYRDDIHKVGDLTEGMICPGIISNVTNFGAFVDIGVHQDGLVHISHLGHKFVTDPKEVVSPGDIVQVKVLSVDKEKSQISLTMRMESEASLKVLRAKESRPAKRDETRSKSTGANNKKRAARSEGRDDKRPKGKSSSNRRPGRTSDRAGGQRPARKASVPFNNPFADLLKK